MMHRHPVDLAHACRLINHGPTVLVSVRHEGRRNVMAAAWSMPVEFTPPRVAVVIDKSTFTRELVLASGGFALSVPCRALADLTYAVGSASGRDVDKFERHGITAFAGPKLGLPLIEGCVAWMDTTWVAAASPWRRPPFKRASIEAARMRLRQAAPLSNATSAIQWRVRRARRTASDSPSNDAGVRSRIEASTFSNALTLTTA